MRGRSEAAYRRSASPSSIRRAPARANRQGQILRAARKQADDCLNSGAPRASGTRCWSPKARICRRSTKTRARSHGARRRGIEMPTRRICCPLRRAIHWRSHPRSGRRPVHQGIRHQLRRGRGSTRQTRRPCGTRVQILLRIHAADHEQAKAARFPAGRGICAFSKTGSAASAHPRRDWLTVAFRQNDRNFGAPPLVFFQQPEAFSRSEFRVYAARTA